MTSAKRVFRWRLVVAFVTMVFHALVFAPAEGLRYLLQQVSSSLQQRLIDQPGQIPLLRIGATPINKWGLDGADAKYQGADIDGSGSYRLYGNLGSAGHYGTGSGLTGG